MPIKAKGTKLPKDKFPPNHTRSDFNCFGPPAVKDGEFQNTMLCDMGCFGFGDVDTNKYYHGAVVQSKLNNNWYAYFEFGRTGQSSPSCQFIEGPDKATAQAEYEKQMHAKNDKRGVWTDKGALGWVLQAKEGKDCYLVRPQATRSTGLADAQTIVHGVVTVTHNAKSAFDAESERLLKDLNMATTDYTRSAMVNNAIPTNEAIAQGRLILDEATKIANKLSSDAAILANKDLGDLTGMMYSLVPKKKNRSDEKSKWWLTPYNVAQWQADLDAFEQALSAQQGVTISNVPFQLSHLDKKMGLGADIAAWMKNATRNNHSHVRGIKIEHIWKVERDSISRFLSCQKKIAGENPNLKEKPLHQVKRFDLDDDSLFIKSGTYMLFHGTRTVNVTGILSTGLRLPSQLSNVAINGAMFGSGLYSADDWKKSAGYCSYDGAYYARGSGKAKSRKAFMFICDVILGQPHVVTNRSLGQPRGTHSLYAKASTSGVANNEFIVFNTDQLNLRYLVEFEEGN